MSYQRTRRIEEEIRKSLSQIIIEQIKDPRIGDLVSIVRVELSKDLKFAKIYVSVFGDKIEKESAMEGLVNASGFLRKELSTALKLRHVPEIHFKLDTSIEHSIAVAGIIKKLSQDKREDSNGPL
jgi:ribosome-binding factor A